LYFLLQLARAGKREECTLLAAAFNTTISETIASGWVNRYKTMLAKFPKPLLTY
jgi:hypothetical protein